MIEKECDGCVLKVTYPNYIPPKCRLLNRPLYQVLNCETGPLVKKQLPKQVDYGPRIESAEQLRQEIKDNVAVVMRIGNLYN